MEIKGKVIAVLPVSTGEGKNGTWKSQDFVIETGDQYPKKICINLFGDKIDQFLPAIGNDVTAHFDIESKEYNGRWYTAVRAWKVDGVSNQSAPVQTQSAPPTAEGSDLPF